MFPDMYLQYNHPTNKSQQKPFDKNRQSPTTSTTALMPHTLPTNQKETQPLQPSSAALMAHHLPAHHKETQPLQPSTTPLMAHHLPAHHKKTQPPQPSSAALMAHHLPSDHSIPTQPKKSLTQNIPSAENTPLNTTNIPNKGYSLYIQHKLPTQAPHKLITPITNAQDGLPEGRLHGRDPVRRSKPLVILGA